ncbi:MAG: hypothetical protein ACNA8K_09260 [Cyclonatronaceae bacterium]
MPIRDGEGECPPVMVFSNPPAGRYDIWVATYKSGDFIQGKLTVTETTRTP